MAGRDTMITRCSVKIVTASTTCQELQVLRDGEPVDDVEHWEPYGLTSYPAAGADALVLSVDGNFDHPIACVVADPAHRPTDLAETEVALYNSPGAEVRLTAAGGVKVTGPVTASAGVDVTGDIDATGSVTALGTVSGLGFNLGPLLPGKAGNFTDATTGLTYIFTGGILTSGTGAL